MKAIVCVKQVPDTSGKVAVKENGQLDRASMMTITNPDDLNAIEAALQLKDQTGCEVVAISMGPPPAESMLRELLARGVDKAVLVSSREFGGSDTYATSQILAAAVRRVGVGPEDVVFCGRQAIDGDTAQVGPQIAEHLGLPVVSYTQDLKIDGDYAIVQRQFEDRYHVLKVKLPCLCTALAELNPPRYMTVGRLFDAFDQDVTTWGRKDLPTLEDKDMGLAGSPTKIARASDKVKKGKGVKVNLDAQESVKYLMDQLVERHVI